MAEKLNSMRLLERQKIAYIARDFPASIHSADGVADYFDLPHKMVYKTLVVLTNAKKPCLVMVAGNHALNLKLFAKAIGQKKVYMAAHKEAERLTGLQTGGISALALPHKNYPVYIDESVLQLERVLVSAGKRGINIELAVADLMKITKAKAVACAR
ncbi:aminoacyl-tRNA deacylase [Anaerolineales bacterium HSG6]|nr:aminoacyl-tRNA deacylase [Anaerolineales bacterium HSG6]MDM8530522.1 aminoacyl-tRNA deacylase [Anaerolineales bacterium HSG25]